MLFTFPPNLQPSLPPKGEAVQNALNKPIEAQYVSLNKEEMCRLWEQQTRATVAGAEGVAAYQLGVEKPNTSNKGESALSGLEIAKKLVDIENRFKKERAEISTRYGIEHGTTLYKKINSRPFSIKNILEDLNNGVAIDEGYDSDVVEAAKELHSKGITVDQLNKFTNEVNQLRISYLNELYDTTDMDKGAYNTATQRIETSEQLLQLIENMRANYGVTGLDCNNESSVQQSRISYLSLQESPSVQAYYNFRKLHIEKSFNSDNLAENI